MEKNFEKFIDKNLDDTMVRNLEEPDKTLKEVVIYHVTENSGIGACNKQGQYPQSVPADTASCPPGTKDLRPSKINTLPTAKPNLFGSLTHFTRSFLS